MEAAVNELRPTRLVMVCDDAGNGRAATASRRATTVCCGCYNHCGASCNLQRSWYTSTGRRKGGAHGMLQLLRQELQPRPFLLEPVTVASCRVTTEGECCNHDQVCRQGDLLEPAPKNAPTEIRSFCTNDFFATDRKSVV